MEIEKIIERLKQKDGLWCSVPTGERLISDAATTLEQLQAENDRLKRERDAAAEDLNAIIGDIEEIRRGYGVDNDDSDGAFADLCGDYCANKSRRCYVEAEKYRCNNFKWRGPKEE